MGEKLQTILTRLTLLVALMLITASTLSPLVAFAAPAMTAKQEADSFIHYKTLEKCFADAVNFSGEDSGGTSFDDVSSYKWFSSASVAVGYLNSGAGGDTGTANCNDATMVSRATSSWGYSNPVSAWCTLMRFAGPARSDANNRDCVSGSGTFLTLQPGYETDRPTSFKRAVEKDFYKTDGGSPQLSGKAKYWLYYQSLVNLCHAKSVAKLEGADETTRGIINTDKGYQIRFVTAEGVVEDWIYRGDGDQTKTSRVGIYEDEAAGGFPTCGELAQWLSDNADAYAESGEQAPTAPTPVNTDDGDPADDTKSTCGVKGGMGWVICPVTQFLAEMVDTMYVFIADQLEVPVTMFNNDPGTYTAWQVFRDYANVAFIIAFLAIVYSQVTSVGISNYGIKKMLPKLIIAAILVNVSYMICQLAVDTTNLMGRGITQLFDGIANAISQGTLTELGAKGADGQGGFSTMIAGILVGGIVLVVALALGLLGPILIAVALVFLILLLRKVLIVILIAISPLAFVAYLLPNTEKWFKKWTDMFMKVLMVFPIVAMVVGASKVASRIVSAQSTNSTNTIAGDSAATITSLIAAAILTIPFFVIPGLLQKSLEAAGKFGGKMENLSKKANGNIGKKFQKSSFSEGRRLRKAGKEQYKKRKFAERVSGGGGLRGWGTRRLARGGTGITPPAFRSAGNQAGLDALARTAQASAADDRRKEMTAAIDDMNRASIDLDGTRQLALGASSVAGATGTVTGGAGSLTQQAAIQKTVASGDVQGIRDLVNSSHTMNDATRKVFADALESSSNRPAFMGAGAISGIRQGTQQDSQALVRSAINSGAYSTEKLAKADRDEVAMVANALRDHDAGTPGATLDAGSVTRIRADANRARTDSRFGAGKNRENLENAELGNAGVFS